MDRHEAFVLGVMAQAIVRDLLKREIREVKAGEVVAHAAEIPEHMIPHPVNEAVDEFIGWNYDNPEHSRLDWLPKRPDDAPSAEPSKEMAPPVRNVGNTTTKKEAFMWAVQTGAITEEIAERKWLSEMIVAEAAAVPEAVIPDNVGDAAKHFVRWQYRHRAYSRPEWLPEYTGEPPKWP